MSPKRAKLAAIREAFGNATAELTAMSRRARGDRRAELETLSGQCLGQLAELDKILDEMP